MSWSCFNGLELNILSDTGSVCYLFFVVFASAYWLINNIEKTKIDENKNIITNYSDKFGAT